VGVSLVDLENEIQKLNVPVCFSLNILDVNKTRTSYKDIWKEIRKGRSANRMLNSDLKHQNNIYCSATGLGYSVGQQRDLQWDLYLNWCLGRFSLDVVIGTRGWKGNYSED
jgi:hypothetical protein